MNVEHDFFEIERRTRNLNNLNLLFRRSRISFDIDQVEADSASSALARVNKLKGSKYSINDLTSYWGLTSLLKRDYKEIKNPDEFAINIWNDPDVIGSSTPVSGAATLSKYLVDNGISAYRITSRPSTLRETTLNWYKKNMPWVNQSLIHIQLEGSEIKSDFKAQKIFELDVNFHFEDSVEHALEITSKSDVRVILVPQPWNKEFIPEQGSNIIKIPDSKYQDLSKMVHVYMHLSDILV